MTERLPSEILGTAGLWVALAVAALIAIGRRRAVPQNSFVRPAALLTLAIQALHFGEEFATGFQTRFPQWLGLTPWSDRFFVLFNIGWICLWALALAALHRGTATVLALAALWFLALSAIGNGLAHPLLAMAVGGYFPGLFTALPLALAGERAWWIK